MILRPDAGPFGHQTRPNAPRLQTSLGGLCLGLAKTPPYGRDLASCLAADGLSAPSGPKITNSVLHKGPTGNKNQVLRYFQHVGIQYEPKIILKILVEHSVLHEGPAGIKNQVLRSFSLWEYSMSQK